MSESRFAAEIRIDVSDLAEGEADEIRDLIEAAIGHYKPTITVDTREYPA